MRIKLDDGFSFGLGVFETIAIENGALEFLTEHMARLAQGASALKIENPAFDVDALMAEAMQAIRESGRNRGVLKITLTKENILFAQRDNTYTPADYERGFSVKLSPILRNETSPFTYVKSLNYGDNIMEKRRAHQEGFDEPVFLNSRGELTEGATTNLFLIKDGKIQTPPVSAGILNGIYRQVVMQRLPVEECTLYPADMLDADGMFLTNSLLHVMAVRQFEAKTFDVTLVYELMDGLQF